MKLTPLDIHHKEFRRSIRGYNEEEVDVFLDQVAEEFERFFKENVELKERVEKMQDKVKQYEGVEQTLQKALFTGQQAADQVRENAIKESEIIVRDAEQKAKEIIQDVHRDKQQLVAELKLLRETETKFRERFQEMLSSFKDEVAQIKVTDLPPEIEEELEKAPETAETVSEAAPEAEIGDTGTEDAAASDSQPEAAASAEQPALVVEAFQPAPEVKMFAPAPAAEAFESAPPVETFESAPPVETFESAPPVETFESAPPVETFQPAPVTEVSEQAEEKDLTIPVPAPTNYFDQMAGEPERLTQSPQAPDVGAPEGSVLGGPAEYKVTFGAPTHEHAETKVTDANDVKEKGSTDVVSSFFDDDLGSED